MSADDDGLDAVADGGDGVVSLAGIVLPIAALVAGLFACSVISPSYGVEFDAVDTYVTYVVAALPWLAALVALLAAQVRVPRRHLPSVLGYAVAVSLSARIILWIAWHVGELPARTQVIILEVAYRIDAEPVIWSALTVIGLSFFLALAEVGARDAGT